MNPTHTQKPNHTVTLESSAQLREQAALALLAWDVKAWHTLQQQHQGLIEQTARLIARKFLRWDSLCEGDDEKNFGFLGRLKIFFLSIRVEHFLSKFRRYTKGVEAIQRKQKRVQEQCDHCAVLCSLTWLSRPWADQIQDPRLKSWVRDVLQVQDLAQDVQRYELKIKELKANQDGLRKKCTEWQTLAQQKILLAKEQAKKSHLKGFNAPYAPNAPCWNGVKSVTQICFNELSPFVQEEFNVIKNQNQDWRQGWAKMIRLQEALNDHWAEFQLNQELNHIQLQEHNQRN